MATIFFGILRWKWLLKSSPQSLLVQGKRLEPHILQHFLSIKFSQTTLCQNHSALRIVIILIAFILNSPQPPHKFEGGLLAKKTKLLFCNAISEILEFKVGGLFYYFSEQQSCSIFLTKVFLFRSRAPICFTKYFLAIKVALFFYVAVSFIFLIIPNNRPPYPIYLQCLELRKLIWLFSLRAIDSLIIIF